MDLFQKIGYTFETCAVLCRLFCWGNTRAPAGPARVRTAARCDPSLARKGIHQNEPRPGPKWQQELSRNARQHLVGHIYGRPMIPNPKSIGVYSAQRYPHKYRFDNSGVRIILWLMSQERNNEY